MTIFQSRDPRACTFYLSRDQESSYLQSRDLRACMFYSSRDHEIVIFKMHVGHVIFMSS